MSRTSPAHFPINGIKKLNPGNSGPYNAFQTAVALPQPIAEEMEEGSFGRSPEFPSRRELVLHLCVGTSTPSKSREREV